MIIINKDVVSIVTFGEMYTTGNVLQIIGNDESHDILFANEIDTEVAFRLIKQEIKRQSSSCRCEIIIDLEEIKRAVKESK